jgi:aspartyl-tRNA(Asn)/glutamyl-tRNA(Gln) amidotransferase subunit C
MSVSSRDVERLARLARIRLEAAAVGGMAVDLNSVLTRLEPLAAEIQDMGAARPAPVETTTEPVSPRADDSGADPLTAPLTTIAPALRDGFFLVPGRAERGSRDDADGNG